MATKKHVPINRMIGKHLRGKVEIPSNGYNNSFMCRRDRLDAYLKRGYSVIHDDGEEFSDLVFIGVKEVKKEEVKKDAKKK